MARRRRSKEDWDHYVTREQDPPIMVLFDRQYEARAPLRSAGTHYRVQVRMGNPDVHGLGTGREIDTLYEVEEYLFKRVSRIGLLPVGRRKGGGEDVISFYGPMGKADALRAMSAKAPLRRRRVAVEAESDASWSYYREALLPDAERRRWIYDRMAVALLEEAGDLLVDPRAIDHWAYFPSDAARQRFIRAARRKGFSLDDGPAPRGDGKHRYGAHLVRDDPAELEHIHEVVMTLLRLAERQGGEYDGWEAWIVPAAASPRG
jgi:hypothetical protein